MLKTPMQGYIGSLIDFLTESTYSKNAVGRQEGAPSLPWRIDSRKTRISKRGEEMLRAALSRAFDKM
jgi:hypothetical protein